MIVFVLGLLLGVSIALFVASLMVAAARADDERAYIRRMQHVCTGRCRTRWHVEVNE